MYVHFRAKHFHCTQCYLTTGERLENGEWSYSTPRVFEEFQQKFPDVEGTYQQLALIILIFHT
jgi:hypothetical protein